MTVGQIMLEIEKLNEEELKNLENDIFDLKRDREIIKREKAINELRKAWDMAVSLGVAIYDNDGIQITRFEDLDYTF